MPNENNINDGDLNAFPFIYDGYPAPGLTKRECFAAMAMQGLCANPHIELEEQTLAEFAVKQADVLILELNK